MLSGRPCSIHPAGPGARRWLRHGPGTPLQSPGAGIWDGPPRVLRGARPAELFSKALNCAACEDFHLPVIAHKAGSSQGGKSRVKTGSQGRCPTHHSAVRPGAPSQSASLWRWHSTSHLLALRRWSQEVQAAVGCSEGLGVCKSRAESCSLATPKRALSTRPRGLPPGPFAQPHGTHGRGGAGVSGRSRAGVCTRWPFAARRESSPLAGSEMIPSPPALLLNQIHLASTATLVIRDPSRAELGLAAGHGGILPPSPTRSGPSCFYSFVFLHFLEEQGEAQALKAAFVQRWGPRGTIIATELPAGPIGT